MVYDLPPPKKNDCFVYFTGYTRCSYKMDLNENAARSLWQLLGLLILVIIFLVLFCAFICSGGVEEDTDHEYDTDDEYD